MARLKQSGETEIRYQEVLVELEVDEIVSAGSRSCGRGVWNMSVHRRRLCHMLVRHMVVTVGVW